MLYRIWAWTKLHLLYGWAWSLGSLVRLWARIRVQGPVWLAGFILIAAGIICLYLSDKVVTGWWQGTLQAFGVGFIVGGLVDVLAISGLNQAQRRRENNLEAELILRDTIGPRTKTADAAEELLKRAGGQINLRLEQELRFLLFRLGEPPPQELFPQPLDAQLPPAETPDRGDAPQAPGNP